MTFFFAISNLRFRDTNINDIINYMAVVILYIIIMLNAF